MLLGAIGAYFLLPTPALGWMVIFMSVCVIGVHGMLSGTASMDFGGKKNAGVAVGIIDGFVYLGTGAQSILYGSVLPSGEAAKSAQNWSSWPLIMIPVSLFGLVLATRVWNAKPQPKTQPVPAPDAVAPGTTHAKTGTNG
jgi:OPA family glycerol-3-phosphate transporter-like MFS transporter